MRVAIQVPAAVMGFVPYPVRVMGQEDFLPVDLNESYIFDPAEAVFVFVDIFVMVAPNEQNVSVKPATDVPSCGIGISVERKITQVVNCIGSIDDGVPITNQSFVHLVGRYEWTIAVPTDVVVVEVCVGGEKCVRHVWCLLRGWRGASLCRSPMIPTREIHLNSL